MGIPGRRWVRWSKKLRAGFLDALAGSCNVKASAAAIGVDPFSVYALRRKDPAFAEEWNEALLAGYALLETEMVGHVLAGGHGKGTIATPGGDIDVELALKLLSAHRTSLTGKWRGGPRLKRATAEETDKAILKKLDAIEQARRRDALEQG